MINPPGSAPLLFRAPGKLLLTGEYLVLQGARALAVPLVYFQTLRVEPTSGDRFVMRTKVFDKPWFEAEFLCEEFRVSFTTDPGRALYLQNIFKALRQARPEFQLSNPCHLYFNLEFDPEWGIGSSSSLLVILSEWVGVDPMELHAKVSRGSGYDVAVASYQQALLFERVQGKPVSQIVSLDFPFQSDLYFVYLGKKQDSESSVHQFLGNPPADPRYANRVGEISSLIPQCRRPEMLVELLQEALFLTAQATGLPIPESPFEDGTDCFFKPLGAWGGDFGLVVWQGSQELLQSALKKDKNYFIVPWSQFVLA